MGTLYVRHGLHSIRLEDWFRLQYEQPEPKPEPAPELDPFHFACPYCGALDGSDVCCSAAWHASEGDDI